MTATAKTQITAGNDRQNQILNALLVAIKEEATEWPQICKGVEELVKVRSNGWNAVRGLLQWLMDNGYVVRTPFDPAAGECYQLAAR